MWRSGPPRCDRLRDHSIPFRQRRQSGSQLIERQDAGDVVVLYGVERQVRHVGLLRALRQGETVRVADRNESAGSVFSTAGQQKTHDATAIGVERRRFFIALSEAVLRSDIEH